MRSRAVMVIVATMLAAACGGGLVSPASSGQTSGATTISLLPGEDPVVAVVRLVLPAVVNVTTDRIQTSTFGGTGRSRGTGTGFIVGSNGVIVTNYHVVERAQRITVTTSGEDPKRYPARVIGGDALADLAVLKVDATDLPTVALGESDSLELGQQLVAIGYALALEGGPSVTTGVVSALDRTITVSDPECDACDNGGRTYTRVVQTDAAINPGNSGGPLVDLTGRVVGINTAGTTSAENIGFAIAIDAAIPTIEHAQSDPERAVAYLGVNSISVTGVLAAQEGLTVDSGAYIVAVVPGGAADEAGLRAGDVIVGFGGQTVTDAEGLGEAIRSFQPGDEVSVEVVLPEGERRNFNVTLGTNPLPGA